MIRAYNYKISNLAGFIQLLMFLIFLIEYIKRVWLVDGPLMVSV
jgi:hypothetical protein